MRFDLKLKQSIFFFTSENAFTQSTWGTPHYVWLNRSWSGWDSPEKDHRQKQRSRRKNELSFHTEVQLDFGKEERHRQIKRHLRALVSGNILSTVLSFQLLLVSLSRWEKTDRRMGTSFRQRLRRSWCLAKIRRVWDKVRRSKLKLGRNCSRIVFLVHNPLD